LHYLFFFPTHTHTLCFCQTKKKEKMQSTSLFPSVLVNASTPTPKDTYERCMAFIQSRRAVIDHHCAGRRGSLHTKMPAIRDTQIAILLYRAFHHKFYVPSIRETALISAKVLETYSDLLATCARHVELPRQALAEVRSIASRARARDDTIGQAERAAQQQELREAELVNLRERLAQTQNTLHVLQQYNNLLHEQLTDSATSTTASASSSAASTPQRGTKRAHAIEDDDDDEVALPPPTIRTTLTEQPPALQFEMHSDSPPSVLSLPSNDEYSHTSTNAQGNSSSGGSSIIGSPCAPLTPDPLSDNAIYMAFNVTSVLELLS
jgi:hypothetical protein